ncbi:hypothetical protein EG329_014165 [Mollisiaceae sp. DMI_Dod_QoI]|nr:hypothetical protein EG329_014165 [Helotiales sp. DMI_Dod_QoI]
MKATDEYGLSPLVVLGLLVPNITYNQPTCRVSTLSITPSPTRHANGYYCGAASD